MPWGIVKWFDTVLELNTVKNKGFSVTVVHQDIGIRCGPGAPQTKGRRFDPAPLFIT
jgi:hypothetical protein